MTPVTVAVSPKEIKVIKCNGVGTCKKKKQLYTLQPDYLSHIVVISKYDLLKIYTRTFLICHNSHQIFRIKKIYYRRPISTSRFYIRPATFRTLVNDITIGAVSLTASFIFQEINALKRK